jgi:hypothetical protein
VSSGLFTRLPAHSGIGVTITPEAPDLGTGIEFIPVHGQGGETLQTPVGFDGPFILTTPEAPDLGTGKLTTPIGDQGPISNAAEEGGSVGEQGTLFDPAPYRAPDSEPEMGYLYEKLSSTGEHLKYGYTKNLETRYTQAEMNGGRLNILAYGPKEDMLALERNLHENLPIGPEEGQTFYIGIQVAKGLRPPPY